jgi:hypothetical protein
MTSLLDLLVQVSSHKLFKWAGIRTNLYNSDAINSKYINIIITDKCNLSCIGCRGSIDNVHQYELQTMSYDSFIKTVDECVKSGICYFDLTPAIGEILLVKDIHKYLNYLEHHEGVKGYLMTTNGTVNNIPKGHKKLNLSLSLYGSGISSFKTFTNKDLFKKCIDTFSSLIDIDTPIEITLRNEDLSDIDLPFRKVMYKLLTKKNVAVHDGRVNDNRGGSVQTDNISVSRKGICPCGVGSGGAIRSDNNYYYCAFNDLGKKSLIGNLSGSSLLQLRNTDTWNNVVTNHVNSNYTDICKTCTAQW